ncbi:MAG: DUF4115 domain-containing protein [Bacteroidetes bacterium]|nr:DUF4115 domain-containing protein [Bacteroidota bacterium]
MDELTREEVVGTDSFQAIGGELSAARLARGQQVNEIAQVLRISKVYIKNIEAGEFDALPGPAYVSGFLRSFAGAVDLDPEEFPRRYRALTAVEKITPTYSFPVDRQRPQRSGAMMASLLVIVVVVGYGGWYAADKPEILSLFGSDSQQASVSADLTLGDGLPLTPDLIVSADSGLVSDETTLQSDISNSVPAATVSLEGPGETILKVENDLRASDQTSEATALTQSVAVAEDMSDAPAKVLEIAESPATPDSGQTGDEQLSIAEETRIDDTGSQIASADTMGADTVGADTAGADTAAAEIEGANGSGDEQDVNAEGVVNEPSSMSGVAFARQRDPAFEITVRATGTSWVEIIRNDGEEVMTSLMRNGETYIVDVRDKLYLSTGNAGGIELLFSDGTVKSVGEKGEILRDMPLDAERLLNQL